MRLGRNLLAGFANSTWSALIGLAVVPLYLKYLGIEAYGLIGFFATTQALLQLLDMGLAPTINREVARFSASGNMREAGNLLHTLAIIYWGMALLIAVLIVTGAPLIAEFWLQSKNLSRQTIERAIMLMGFVIACRWPVSLYQGALMGAHRLVVVSNINILMVTLGSLGAVGVLAFVSPTIEAFFIWHAGIGLVYAVFIRWAAWKIIPEKINIRFDVNRLKKIWRFSAGMSGLGVTTLIFTQLDKVILSKVLGLEEFGHYMLAIVVVSGLYILTTPTFNIIYPRFTALVAKSDSENLNNLYQIGVSVFAVVIFPIAMFLTVFPKELLYVWTGNQNLTEHVAPIISILAIGSALHAMMHFPYALQLAYGAARIPLIINGILMIFMMPLILILASKYGAIGGALTWLLLHLAYLILGTWLTHRHLLKGMGMLWLIQAVCIPLVISVFFGVIGHFATIKSIDTAYIRLICGVVLTLMACIVSVVVHPKVRMIVLHLIRYKNLHPKYVY